MQFHRTISIKQAKDTGLVFSLVALVIFFFFQEHFLLITSAALLAVALLLPVLLKPAAFLWYNLAEVLGFVSSRLLLSLIFFLVVTPVALVRRMLGVDRLVIKSNNQGAQTAFVEKNKKYSEQDLRYPF